ncbi:hypothetical protein scyTo_0005455 [Scyliorhinus torazame]|uniref:RFX-type winged-helix domain-containing protein n=1 Tax=Scyliorhinus torazame TaxID=75743 RepID=A0A401P8C0_SCYTO|nr:hypothetical protein [Scyliorhinus torazame]
MPRYLESYEKLHHFGEDDEVLTPTNSRPQGVVSGVHLFYNRHQHIIPESVRRGYGLFTEFTTISDYNKVVLSLLSGLPNEVDFAINVCTLMSHGNKQMLQMEKDPKVVTLLLAHAGIFDDSPGTYLNVYESEWKVKSGRDFIKFWKETVEDHEVRELIGDKSQKSKEAASDDRWDSVLFHPPQKLGINDLEGQRVLQIAVIIHNLSMEEGNAKLLANRTCLRFLLLCAHNRHVSLKQMGLDTLGNVMAELQLDPIDFQSTQVIFHTITKCLYSSDKWFRIRGMEILANLCKIEENVDIICECVEQESYREIVNHLSLQDILLLLASLEALYMLSSLGEVTCTKIIKVERSIDQLVCLVSVDMQNFPPDALAAVKLVEQPSTLQQQTSDTSRSATTENVSNQSTPVTALRPLGVPSASLLEADSEAFTCQWLNANFEESADSSIYRVDLYSEYLSLCSKLGSSGILTSTGFTKCLRLTFPNHTIKKIEDAGANGQSQFHVVGIKRRAVPLPVAAFHQEQQTPNHSTVTIKAGSVPSNTTVNSIAVGMTVPSPALQMHRTLTSTSKLLLPIPQVSSSVTRAQSPQVVYQMMANTVPSVGVQSQSQQLVVSQSNLQILQPHGGLQTVQIIPGQFISTTSPSTILQGPPLNQQVTVTVVPNTNLTNTHVTQLNTNPANSLPGDHSAKPVISTHVIQSSHVPFNQSNTKVDEFEGEKNVCQKAEDATKLLSSQSQEQTVGLIENSFSGNACNASNGHLNGRVDQTGMLLNGETKKENPSSGMNHCGFVESTSAFQESKASSGANLTNGDPMLEKPGAAEMKNVLKRPLINGDSDFAKGDRSHIGKDIPNEKSVASNHLGNGEILNQEHQDAKCRLDGESSQPGKMCNGPSSTSNVKSHAHTTVIVPNPTVQQAHRNSVLTSGTAAVTFNVTLPQPHHNGNMVIQSNPIESSQVTTCQSSNTLSASKLSTCEGQQCRQAVKRPGEDAAGVSMAGIPNKVGVRIMTVSDPTKAGSNTMMVAVPAGATINTATIEGVPKVGSPAPVSNQQTATQHPQSQVSPAVEQYKGPHSSQVTVSAPEAESARKPNHSFMCLWKDCKRWFETPSQVFYHAATEHGGKDVYQGQCMWEGCEPLPRQRLSFITHLQDKHCSRETLLIGLKRLEQKAQTSTSQTAVRQSPSDGTAPTPKSHKALVNHPSAALMALRKGSRNLIFKNYLDEKEGPIVKHIRLTSALILKNVARYSELGRMLLKRHENHLSVLAISGMEASTALAKCLYELNSQEQSESTESKR